MAEQQKVHWVKYRAHEYLSNEDRIEYSLAERGLLADLQDLIRVHGNIPAEPKTLAKRLYVTLGAFKRASTRVLKEFVPDGDGRLTHPMVKKELAEVAEYMARQRENGAKGGRPKKPTGFPRDNDGEPTAKPWGNPTNNQQPATSNQGTTNSAAGAEADTEPAAASVAGVSDLDQGKPVPGRQWPKWAAAMRAPDRFPMMNAEVERRIQKEVLDDTPAFVTDRLLTNAIAGFGWLFIKADNPVLCVQKLCDDIIEEEYEALKRSERENAKATAAAKVFLYSKNPESRHYWECTNQGCGSSVRWNHSRDLRVCGPCCTPLDTRLREKVASAIAAEDSGETAESRSAAVRIPS